MGIIYQHQKKKQGTQNMTFLQILKPTIFSKGSSLVEETIELKLTAQPAQI